MKVHVNLLTLCVFHHATAFLAPAFKGYRTALSSSYRDMNGDNLGVAYSSDAEISQPPLLDPFLTEKSGLKTVRSSSASSSGSLKSSRSTQNVVRVQGGSLKTWSFAHPNIEKVHVSMKTEGRPLNANVELWQGPDNIPQRMGVYTEDGSRRPFNAVVGTPRATSAVAIRNTGDIEFPLDASLEADLEGNGLGSITERLETSSAPRTIQGGALHTYPFDARVSAVQVLLKTDGRPLQARLELLQGPNTNKQVVELYCEDGYERPFFAVIETPGSGNVVRIVNAATMEFPITAHVEAFSIDDSNPGRSAFNVN